MAVRNGSLGNIYHELNGVQERVTRVLPVHKLNSVQKNQNLLELWAREKSRLSDEADALLEAAEALRTSDIPVAFPTETVYGLGADATRSAAVRGIYKAKRRPSDNPLIVHVGSREQLLRILRPSTSSSAPDDSANIDDGQDSALIPPIYEPLISRFWPGPLTIILPNPPRSLLAPEVTSTLSTFGARMPSSPIARLLIHLADRPLAAPSANVSTKPSPTTAQHVYTDLHGRIDIILDGGPCRVGVESTVVDGLSDPPAILRPGGVGIEEIRACPGWESVRVAYKDGALHGKEIPRAPGMKYKHYSPRAKVVLFETDQIPTSATKRVLRDLGLSEPAEETSSSCPIPQRIGVVRTRSWKRGLGLPVNEIATNGFPNQNTADTRINDHSCVQILPSTDSRSNPPLKYPPITMFDISLGTDTRSIARKLFSALRSLDEDNVDIIYVEGISDKDGDLAAAIMNRLRKAAEENIRF